MVKKLKEYKIQNENKDSWKKLRVAVYTRVSTNDQYLNWVWLESQYGEIKRILKLKKDDYFFNEKKNYYEEKWESWADEHRPELDRMVSDIEKWEIDIIFVYKIDRLFRKLLYLLQFIEKISKRWVFLNSINDNIDTSDSRWMVMLQFMWIIWDIERDNIRLRTIDWKVTKARKWYYVWWWKTPFGYDLHSTPWWKKLKINNDEAKIVNRIYDMYINDDLSLWEIARRLTIEWIPTRDDRLKIRIEKDNSNIDKYKDKYKEENNGLEIDISHKKWTKKENDWMWHWSSIRKILSRSIYTWVYYYWATTKEWDEKQGKNIIVETPVNSRVEFECPEILKDTSLFDQAIRKIEKNKTMKKNTNYIFSWLIKCWLCHYWYNWYKTSNWTLWYRCKWWTSSWNLKHKCKNSELSEIKLYEYCWSELDRNLSNPDNFKSIVFNEAKNKEIIAEKNRRISELQKNIKLKETSLENAIIKELEATTNSRRIIYKRSIDAYEKQITEFELEENKLKKEISIIKSNERRIDDIKSFNSEHEKAVEWLTEHRKIELIKKYVEQIIRKPWKIVISFNIFDNLDWKDWREWEDSESVKTKTSMDFFDRRTLSLGDKIINYRSPNRKKKQ